MEGQWYVLAICRMPWTRTQTHGSPDTHTHIDGWSGLEIVQVSQAAVKSSLTRQLDPSMRWSRKSQHCSTT